MLKRIDPKDALNYSHMVSFCVPKGTHGWVDIGNYLIARPESCFIYYEDPYSWFLVPDLEFCMIMRLSCGVTGPFSFKT